MTGMLDVLVVGGGPIGLATAIEARMVGLSVTVVEPRRGPIDKACGEGLMPGALAALERLGIDPPGHVIAGISYQAGNRRVDHAFRHRLGRGVRRTTMHKVMSERAVAVGVNFMRGTVDALEQDDKSATARLTDGTGQRAHWLLGADGLHSTVRNEAGLASPMRGIRRYGLRRHFAAAPWNELVEVHWTPTAELYVTPVGDGEVGVAVLGPQHTDYDAAIRSVPALAERLRGRAITTSTRGAGPFHQRTTARTAGRILLVGDASGYVDAITGEGIRVGLAQARAAIACIVLGEPRHYEREWRRVTRDFRMLTSGLVALAASPLRPAIVPLARALPSVYGAVVERLAQ